MAFTFSLAAVLALRRQREQHEERTLTTILHELAAARETAQRVEEELRRLHAAQAQSGPQRLQAVSLHEQYARLHVLEEGRTEMLSRVHDLATRRDTQQQIYLAARRDREVLDELEDRQRATFTTDAVRREQKRMDDLFLARRLRS